MNVSKTMGWVVVGLVISHTQSNAVEFTQGIGVYVGGGDYGETSKTITRAVTVQAKVRQAAWSLKAATALVSLSGPGSIDRDGSTERSSSDHTLGIGDVWITGSHAWYSADRRGIRSLYGKVKLPVASSSKGLGTNEFDWELGMEGARGFAPGGVFGKVGYRWRGDREDIAFDNGGVYLAGLYGNISANSRGGLSYEWRHAVRPNGDPTREGMVYFERRNAHGRMVTVYVVAGDSSASVDMAAGLELAWRFFR